MKPSLQPRCLRPLLPRVREVGWGLALLAAGAVGGCAPGPESGPGSEADEAPSSAADLTAAHRAAMVDSLRAAMQDFQEASVRGEGAGLPDLYSDTAAFRFYENGRLAYSSAGDIRQALDALAPGARLATEFDGLEILPLAPGVGVVHAAFQTTFAAAEGDPFTFEGAMTVIWTHEAQGWRILGGHTSSPVPQGQGG